MRAPSTIHALGGERSLVSVAWGVLALRWLARVFPYVTCHTVVFACGMLTWSGLES